MHRHVHILNPIDYPGWDELLASSQNCTFYHTSAWAKVLCETYHYRPVYFALPRTNCPSNSGATEATTAISAGFLAMVPMMEVRSIFTGRRGVCLPFTDQCEYIGADGFQVQDLLDCVKEYARQHHWGYIELRWGDYPDVTPAMSFYGHLLDLTVGIEQLFSRLRHSVRTNIRKAVRQDVKVSIHRSVEALKKYYRLHCIGRKRHGLPPQPYCFFEKVYEHIISKNLGFIVLAYHRGKSIAGAMFFAFGDRAICKFAASDYTYQHLRANNLVIWEAIKWYTQHGYRSLCFGRTEMGNSGLRRFKMGWGMDERILNYYRYDLQREAFVTGGQLVKTAYRNVFRTMPVPLLRLCGSILYKHVG